MAYEGVTAASGDIRTDFMELLVVQLQNQNPMEPLDNSEMAAQLAQLSSLEQLENMNGTFQMVLLGQQKLEAMAMIGKEVDFVPEGMGLPVTGQVEEVMVSDTGVRLKVGEYEIDLAAVESVRG